MRVPWWLSFPSSRDAVTDYRPPVSGTNQSTVTHILPIVKYIATDPGQTLSEENTWLWIVYSLFKTLSQGLFHAEYKSSPLYSIRFYVSYTWHAEQPQKPQRLCVCRYIANETLNFTNSNTTLECPHTYCNNKVKMFWKVFHQNSIIWTLAFCMKWQAHIHWEEKLKHHHCCHGTHSIWDENIQY